MTPLRVAGILLALAFVGIAVHRTAGGRTTQGSQPAEAASRERTQQFWSRYREASQRRAAGDLEGAIELYQQAVALRPHHEDSLYYLGNCYLESRRYSEALSTYDRLIAANRLGSSRGYVQIALIHADRRPGAPYDLEKADRYFRQALAVDPDSGALLGIGEIALLRGEWQQAREALEGVNRDDAMSVAAPYLLGYLSWRADQRDEAWRWFRLAVTRCKVKKPLLKWSEEGDLKADPELRWRALARQSVLGSHWIRLRAYLKQPHLSPDVMGHEYTRLRNSIG
jgi:tetratricopeptide (TPR) repeat protein